MTKCVYRTMLPGSRALALWGAAPAIAQANVGWRLNGSPLTGSIATSYKGTMKLSDPGLFSLGAECEDATEGSSTFGGVGEITQWTASKCVSIDVCEKSTSTIEPLNLPWHSELVLVEARSTSCWSAAAKARRATSCGARRLGTCRR